MSFTKTAIVASAALLAGEVQGAFQWGSCANNGGYPVAAKNFDIQAYTGLWYEIVRDKELWYEANQDCVTPYYTYRPDAPVYKIGVNNGSLRRDTGMLGNGYLWGEPGKDETVSQARCNREPGTGKCNVAFWWYPEGIYDVLKVEYNNYAVVYGCDDWIFGIFSTKQLWILSRTQTMDANLKKELLDWAKWMIPNYDQEKQLEDAKQGGDCKYNAYNP